MLNLILLYLDPGTGSILVQSIIAIVAGIGFYAGMMRKKIISFFTPVKKSEEEDERK